MIQPDRLPVIADERSYSDLTENWLPTVSFSVHALVGFHPEFVWSASFTSPETQIP